MKSQSSKLTRLSILAIAMLLSFGGSARAANYWFDVSGTNAGFGVVSGSTYNWLGTVSDTPAGPYWSGTSTGTAATVAWPGGTNGAGFVGAGASTSYVVRLGATGTNNVTIQNLGLNWDFATGTAMASGDVAIGNLGDTGSIVLNGANSIGTASGTLTINNGYNLGAQTSNFRGGTIVINGLVAGTGKFAFSGSGGLSAGTLTLSNTANTYSGRAAADYVAANYTLAVTKLANGGANSSIGTSSANIGINGGTLRFIGTGAQSTNLGLNIASGGANLDASGPTSSDTITISGAPTYSATNQTGALALTGSNSGNNIIAFNYGNNGTGVNTVTKNGSGKWVLTGSNAFTGAVTISNGVLAINNSYALGTGTTAKTITINASANKWLELDSSISGGSDITLSNQLSFITSGVAGVIRNVAGNNTINGTITMSTGNGDSKITSDGGTLTLNGTISASAGTRVLDLSGSSVNNNTFNGVLTATNTPALRKSGSGLWILSNANTFAGATTITGGTLKLTNNLALQNSAVDVGTGTLDLTSVTTPTLGGLSGSTSIVLPVNVTSLTLNPASGVTATYAASLTGGAAGLTLTKTAAGVQILSGSANYDGLTTVGAGVLGVGHNNALGTTTGATTVSNGAQLQLQNGVTVTGETVTIAGSGPATGNGAFNGGLSTAAGATAEWAGTVIFGDSSARIGSGAGSTLTLSGAVLGSGSNQTLNIGAGVGGSGTVILSAAAGTNIYTGSTLIARGTLKLGANDTLPTGTILDVDYANASEDAIFDLNGFNQTVAGLQRSNSGGGAGGSFVTNSSTTSSVLTVNTGTAYTYSGQVTGNLGLTKSGTGSLTLTASNSYTGATTVSNGTLNLNGSLVSSGSTTVNAGTLNVNGSIDAASAVTVAGGATLGGSGVVSGTATISSGGIVAAGFNVAGNLTIGNLVFSGSGAVNVSGNGVVVGSALNVTGLLTTAGPVAINLSNPLGWTNGTPYELVAWNSIGGTGTSSFTVGSVLNASPRQTPAISFSSGTSAVITFSGDNPKWTGADNSNWVVGATGANSNWVLISATTATNYISGDVVLFNDDASNFTVNISASNVTPSSTTFDTINTYTLQSSGGFGMAGSGGITKSSGGTLTITSSNSYTGVTTISAGTLQIGDGTTDGSIASTASIANEGTLTYNLVGSQANANPITGTGQLVKNGAGELTLSGSNGYSGGTIINTGTLVATSANALGTGGVTSDATLNLTATGAPITYTGLSTSLSGTGTVNVSLAAGSASTLLNGNYSGFTGVWNVGVTGTGGKVQMNGLDNAGATVNVLPNATIYVTGGGTHNAALKLGGGDTGESLGQLRVDTNALEWAGPVTLAGTVTGTNDYTFGGSATLTISGPINETGPAQSLIKGGNNTLILSNSNSYSGGTTISAGTLSVSEANNLGAPSANLVFDGGALQITGTTLTSISGIGHAVSFNSGKTVGISISDPSNTFTVDQVLNQGAGGLTKAGNGTLVLNQPNTYTGITTINGGTVSANTIADATSSSIGLNNTTAGALTFGSTGGTLNFTGASGTTTRAVAFTGQGTFDIAGGSTLSVGATGAASATSGAWTGSGGVIKTGSGTLTIKDNSVQSGRTTNLVINNNNGGTFTMQSGTLNLQPQGAAGGSHVIIGDNTTGVFNQTGGTVNFAPSNASTSNYFYVGITNAGTFNITGGTFTADSAQSGGIQVARGATGTVSIGGGAGTALVDTPLVNFGVSTAGTGFLNLYANGTLLTSKVSVSNGTNTANFDGGTLKAKSSTTTFMSGLTTAAITSNGLTVDTNTFDVTIGQALSGSGGIIKTSAGMLTLSGSNTYEGGTTVNTGGVTFANLSAKSSAGTHAFAAATTLGLGVSGSGNYFTSTDIDNAFSGTMTGNLSNVTVTATTNVGIDTSAGDFTYASSVPSVTKGLVKLAANTLTLSGSNAYTGGAIINGGILAAANNNALGSGTVNINTGAQRLVVNDGVTIANNIVINGGGVSSRGLIENSGAGNATVSGTITINNVLSGGGDFASTGGGTLTVAGPIISAATPMTSRLGTVIYSGGGSYNDFTLQQGTAMLGSNNGLSTSAAMDLGVSGTAVFDLAGYNQSLVGITKSTNGATIANSSTTSDSLLTLTGTSTYSGLITNVTGAGTRKTALAINSGGFLTYTGNYTADTVTVNGTLAINSNGGDSFAPTSRSIVVNSGGLLTYVGSNRVQNDTVITVNTGGTFDENGQADSIGYIAGGGTITNLNGLLTVTLPSVGSGSNFSGTISGTSGLIFVGNGTGGPGTQILSGSNSYTGNTTIQKGRVIAGNVNAFGAAGRIITLSGTAVAEFATDTTANAYVINVGSGSVGTVEVNRASSGTNMTHTMGTATIGNGTLNVQGGANVTGTATLEFQGISLSAGGTGLGTATLNPTTANILVSGSITRPGGFSNSLTLDGTSTGNVIAGPITGALIVNKNNSSTWTLSGSNSYTGATNVNGGTLDVNNYLASTTLNVAASGTLNLNAAVATGTATAVSVSGLANFNGPDTAIHTVGSLNIATSGTAVLTAHTGGASNVKVLDLSALTISGTSPFAGGGTKTAGFFANEIVDPAGYAGTGIASPAPVPEPGTIGLLAVGAIGGLLLRRRNRRSGSR